MEVRRVGEMTMKAEELVSCNRDTWERAVCVLVISKGEHDVLKSIDPLANNSTRNLSVSSNYSSS